MMRTMTTFLILSFLAPAVFAEQTPVANTSAWVRSGGEGVARNPWFLNNTKDISYCIEINSANFGVDKTTAQNKVKKALEFWQSEFSKTSLPSLPTFGAIKIAAHTFTEKTCDDQTDLKFQFGTLSPSQIERLGNPNQHSSLAVRTQYDTRTLRGQGFLYFAAANGPLAYKSDGYLQNLWARENSEILYRSLVHELGHVFGLPNLGSYGELMAEGYIESLINQAQVKTDGKIFGAQALSFFSLVKSSPTICPDSTLLKDWRQTFQLREQDRCVQFRFVHDAQSEFFGGTEMQVWASPELGQEKLLITKATLSVGRFTPTALSLLWLNDEQEVFDKIELQRADLGVIGTPLMSLTKRGFFISADGQLKTAISVRFEQGSSSFTIDGINSAGEIITLL